MSIKWTRVETLVTASFVIGLMFRAEGLLHRSFWLDEVLTLGRATLPTIDALMNDLDFSPFPPSTTSCSGSGAGLGCQ